MKVRPSFRDLKKNQCAFCKELGYQKVNCLRIKDWNKELKTEANLVRMISTQSGSTSQVGRSDSNSTIFCFSIITPTIGYSCDSKQMQDTELHIMCVLIGTDFLVLRSQIDVLLSWVMIVHVTWKGQVQFISRYFDGMVGKLKEVRYISQLKKNLISVDALKALGLEVFLAMVFSR